MPLKHDQAKRRHGILDAVSYRVPCPVTHILLFSNGDSYPLCPRCGCSLDREYMKFCDCCGQRLAWQMLPAAVECHAPRKQPVKIGDSTGL